MPYRFAAYAADDDALLEVIYILGKCTSASFLLHSLLFKDRFCIQSSILFFQIFNTSSSSILESALEHKWNLFCIQKKLIIVSNLL